MEHINFSLYILIGIMAFILMGIILWRILTRNKSHVNMTNNKIGSVSKKLNDFALSMNSIYDFDIIYNIIFKNKYAKIHYSLIPILLFNKGIPFYVTDIIVLKKKDKILFQDNKIYKNSENNLLINLSQFKEINRFLKSYATKLDPEILIPVIGEINGKIKLPKRVKIMNSEKIAEFVSNSNNEEIDLNLKISIIKKLESINLYKSKNSINRKKVRKLEF